MASSFDRWEKDPFFFAAEEVQESADRMESTYRTWIHAKKDSSSMWNCEELQRDLQTALSTTKWQLDEFVRAVTSFSIKSATEDSRDRHHQFITVMDDHISKIETSLQESALAEGKSSQLPWVHLDEGDSNELALFLSGPASASEDKSFVGSLDMDNEEPASSSSKNSQNSTELGSDKTREEKLSDHRRTDSAGVENGDWKITVYDDQSPHNTFCGDPQKHVHKTSSFSGFLSSVECASKFKLSKNGFRKWKAMDRHQETDTALLPSSQFSRNTQGMTACYERSKSCLDGCDGCYDKQLHGWFGAIQRQLQRSQYQMQYNRPVQLTFSGVLLLLIGFLALHAI